MRRLAHRPSKPARGNRHTPGGMAVSPMMLLAFVCVVFVVLPILVGTIVMTAGGGRAHGNPPGLFVAQASPQRQEFASALQTPRAQQQAHGVRSHGQQAQQQQHDVQAPPARAIAQKAETEPRLRAARAAPPTRFLTFERYPGRLNNQLLTLDWAFRFARAFNRTVVVAAVKRKIDWVGLPESRAEEARADDGASLWDVSRLRSRFDFALAHEVDALGAAARAALGRAAADLDPRCVWTEKDGKHLVRWLKRAHALPACAARVHLETHRGLVHPYKSDTRSLGVGPLAFWGALRPAR